MSLEEFLNEWHSDSPCVEVKTSGSTGAPKRMLVEKSRMRASARMTCDFLGLKQGDSTLLCMSLDYIAGKMMAVRSEERGLKLTSVQPDSNPLASFAGQSAGFDLVAMVPLQVFGTMQNPAEREQLSHCRHLIIGGGAVRQDLEMELQSLTCQVWSSYGMTETLSHIALRRVNGPERSDWYEPLPGVDVWTDERGCLVVKAPHVCSETLVTNDLAELTETEGRKRFRIRGRIDNVICSGGVKIPAEEVEKILEKRLPLPFNVTWCSDEKYGQTVVLMLQADCIAEAKEVCNELLPRYWRPKHYLRVPQIPTTETGKPARAAMAELAERLVNGGAE